MRLRKWTTVSRIPSTPDSGLTSSGLNNVYRISQHRENSDRAKFSWLIQHIEWRHAELYQSWVNLLIFQPILPEWCWPINNIHYQSECGPHSRKAELFIEHKHSSDSFNTIVNKDFCLFHTHAVGYFLMILLRYVTLPFKDDPTRNLSRSGPWNSQTWSSFRAFNWSDGPHWCSL